MKVLEQDSFTTRLDQQAYQDLYEQAKSSIAAYLFLFLALIFATPMFHEHTLIASILAFAATSLSGMRLYVSRTAVKTRYQLNPQFRKKLFFYSTLSASLLWGFSSLAIVYYYEFNSMPSVYAMVMTCGIISGAVVSMAAKLKLMRLYIALTLLPIPIWGLICGEWTASILFFFYIPAISVIGKKIHISYMENTRNTMLLAEKTAQLQVTIKDLTHNSETLKDSSGNLTTISGEMHGFSSEMTLQAEHVAAAADNLVEKATSISAAIDQTSGNVQVTVISVDEMSQTIAEIAGQSAKALTITTSAVSQADRASIKISELDSAARKIGNISEVITQISEQTNLLALNATIEAARAGEAGKGFAVVANEIKVLARQTAEATSGIKEQVNDIQSATTESSKEIVLISEIISEVNDIVITVTSAIEEQSSATKEIESNVEEMARGIGEISKNMLESNASNKEIVNTIRTVRNEAQKNLEGSAMVKVSAGEMLEMASQVGNIIKRLNSDT